jgi:Zn-dependent M28 family amino/carboxypeptidase
MARDFRFNVVRRPKPMDSLYPLAARIVSTCWIRRPCSLSRLAITASIASALIAGWASASPELAARRAEAHTTFLADDLLEGRGTGTRGYALAARYVATQFARIGLQPAGGNGSYEQVLTLRETVDDLEAGRLILRSGGRDDALAAVEDTLVRTPAGEEAAEVTAPAVFVGFAVQAPELGYDDLGSTDLSGKIAVVLSGAPPSFPADQRAHYSNAQEKLAALVSRGAIGVITIVTPRDEARYPWPFFVAQGRFPRMRLVDAAGTIVDGFPQLRAAATVKRAAADRLFAPTGRSAADVFAASDRGEPQSFDLDLEVALSARATVRTVKSANVLGLLPGTDLTLASEPVVITAHLDHIGIGPAVDGDTIYNGAMDNAIGTGLLLAVAEALAGEPGLRRPVLFAALTAEEKGLLGAEHLARNPPADVRRFAANVNIDMPLFMSAVRDVIAWGAEHSTLGDVVAKAAQEANFTVSPDPLPDEVIFVRSDQYPFVRTGVPAVYICPGQRFMDPNVDGAEAWNTFLKQRYHKPSDDLAQPIDWPSVGAFAELTLAIARRVANDPKPPAWNENNFFGERFDRDRRR